MLQPDVRSARTTSAQTKPKQTEPELSENAVKVLQARYLIRNEAGAVVETPKELFERVATFVAEADTKYGGDPDVAARQFYELMANRYFEPNTPTLVNFGRPNGLGQGSACFVLPVPDTMHDIFTTMRDMAMIHKSGGGTGFSFSRVRPKSDFVSSTTGIASGPVSFMRAYDHVTECVKQSGVRRGANMGILRVDHPDILEFIDCKQDTSEITNFNISVGVTDAFMTAVDADTSYDLINPRTGKIIGQLNAREVLDKIVNNAWRTGEPGLFFVDRANRLDPLAHLPGCEIESTNPCVPGETLILTRTGMRRIDTLVEQSVDVWNGEQWATVQPAITGTNRPLLRIELSDGHRIRCTYNHTFYLADGTKVQAKDLRVDDRLEKLVFTPPACGTTTQEPLHAYLAGFYQGDGFYNTEKDQQMINFYGVEKIVIARKLEDAGLLKTQPYSESQDRVRAILQLAVPEKGSPASLEMDRPTALAYLAGLLDSDGNIAWTDRHQTAYGYQISSINRRYLASVQLLLRQLGVPSTLAQSHEAQRKDMPGGTYDCQRCWRLSIAASSAVRLLDLGLETFRLPMTENHPAREATRFPRVANITEDGVAETVYCFTELERGRGVFNGIITGQCGEVPLSPFNACTLGSINLSRFIENDSVNYSRLGDTVKTAVHFLDNVLDQNKYPIDAVYEVTRNHRKIGLGVMGWADALVELGIPYASNRALALAVKVMQFINETSITASEELAVTRGAFPLFDKSKWAKAGQAKRRNATTTVIAPTGSISIVAGCSGGCEPLFAICQVRNQADMEMVDFNPQFQTIAEREGFWTDAVRNHVMATGSVQDCEDVPKVWRDVFKTANEIPVEWHVKMQAAFQRHTQDAVSKCIAAGTLIPTSAGLVPIEAFSAVESDDTFAEPTEKLTTGGYAITSHYRAGWKSATRIRLDNGAELVGATASHKVLTTDGWRLLKDLRLGDIVIGRFEASHGPGGAPIDWTSIYKTNANRLDVPTQMTALFAEFIGMLCADGHLTESTGAVGLSCKDDVVEARFTELCQRLFDRTPRRIVDKRTNVASLTLTSRNLVRCLTALIGQGAYDKHAPDQILRGSAKEKQAFLRGVTLDGYRTNRGLCVYEGMSKTLAYHVAELCRSFGVPKVYQNRKHVSGASREGAFAYGVTVSGAMQALIDCVEPHKNGTPANSAYKVLVDRTRLDERVPVDHPNYGALQSLRTETERQYCLSRIAEAFGWPTDTPVYVVKAIEDAGQVELFDIEVADAHEYVVNGMVSHNTINLKQMASVDDVRRAYRLAWDEGCKGITVYRDKSRENQTLTAGSSTTKEAKVAPALFPLPSRPYPNWTWPVETPVGKLSVKLGEDPDTNRLFEVWLEASKAGTQVKAYTEAIARMASLVMRIDSPVPPERRVQLIIDQLHGLGGNNSVGFGPDKVLSLPDGAAKGLKILLADYQARQRDTKPENKAVSVPVSRPSNGANGSNGHKGTNGTSAGNGHSGSPQTPLVSRGDICPSCHQSTLYPSEGCATCCQCGFSKC